MIAKIKHYFLIAKPYLMAISGYLFLWVVFGNLLGEILVQVTTEESLCNVYGTTFGVFVAECKNNLLIRLFDIFVGLPRVIAAFIYLFIILIINAISKAILYHKVRFTLEAFMGWFIPFLLSISLILPGFYYWRKKIPILAWVSLFILSVIVIYSAVIM